MPVDALTRASSLGKGKPDPLRPVAELNGEVPARVSAWITKALAVHQEDRPPSAAAMRRELSDIRSGLTEELPPTLPLAAHESPDRESVSDARARPRRRILWLAGAVAVAALLVAGWLLDLAPGGPPVASSVRSVEGEGFEFQWAGKDLWILYEGDQHRALKQGTAGAVVPPGRYRIAPNSDPVFEPVEFVVEAGRKTVIAPSSGSFEFQWAGKDLWNVYRGEKQVALHQGTATRVVAPGRYRIAPNSDPVFEPVEFVVEADQKTLMAPPSGSFEFQWAGKDLWNVYRGEKQVALHQGTATRVVAPGRYRIAPNSDPVFESVEFVVEAGQKAVIAPPSGTFEFQWAGKDLWNVYRGDKQVALHQGTATRVVAPGRYRIAPNSGAAFAPVEFTVEPGQKTTVKPR